MKRALLLGWLVRVRLRAGMLNVDPHATRDIALGDAVVSREPVYC